MKVLFTNPPWYKEPTEAKPGWRGVRAGSRWPHTFEVHSHTIKDGMIAELVGGYLPFPVWLATAAAFSKREGFDTVLRDSISMGETYESFYNFIKDCGPDFVMLESSTPTVRSDLEIAKRIRSMHPNVKILFTGLHVEFEEEDFLEAHPEIDFTIYGEYEVPTLKLMCALRDGNDLDDIPALIHRNNGTVKKNKDEPQPANVIKIQKNPFTKLPDLSTFPWAERESLPNLNYFDGVCGLERPQLQLMATRGCPYGCIFCAWPQMLFRGPRYRKRSADDVIDEIKSNLAKVPYKSIYIDDDTFNISKDYVLEFSKKMVAAGIGGVVPWSTMGRADLMDRQTLEALRDSGLFSIKYGVESGDQAIIDEIDKRMNVEKNIAMIRLTKELGIRVHLTFTFGLPSDTAETIEATIALACMLPADTVQFSIATPFPGTEMYRMYDEKGWIVSKNWDDYNGSTVAVSRTENFTGAELEAYVVEAYRRFDKSQIEKSFSAGQAMEKLRTSAAALSPGDSVVVMQTSRVPLTRWMLSTLQGFGLDVHVVTPMRFKEEFSSMVSKDKIHSMTGHSHFSYELNFEWASTLRAKHKFKGVFIPYTFESRNGYGEVEQLAEILGGQIVAGITQRGNLFSYAA